MWLSASAARATTRDALGQVERAGHKVEPLLEGIVEQDANSPLAQTDIEERLVSDYHGTGMTVGPHPMFYRRKKLQQANIKSAAELRATTNGKKATVAGCVITRQRRFTRCSAIDRAPGNGRARKTKA